MTAPRRLPGGGWLALIGGGEFTFEETLDADSAWLEKIPPERAGDPVGFVPAASGSVEYGEHFTTYLAEVFERDVVTIPIYRARDARRGKNLERLEGCSAVYLGGGVTDHLLGALADSPVAETLARSLASGAVVVAIAAAAQALGAAARSIRPGETLPGLGWLPGGVVEPNFDPGHDRRLRRLLQAPGARWGLGLPAGSCLLLGPDGAAEVVGEAWTLDDSDGELEPYGPAEPEPELP
ncbi:MAG: Type 1 glutamine amidotransferase-like domain-containing protein [Thermoanaerobaculia bacterium]